MPIAISIGIFSTNAPYLCLLERVVAGGVSFLGALTITKMTEPIMLTA